MVKLDFSEFSARLAKPFTVYRTFTIKLLSKKKMRTTCRKDTPIIFKLGKETANKLRNTNRDWGYTQEKNESINKSENEDSHFEFKINGKALM